MEQDSIELRIRPVGAALTIVGAVLLIVAIAAGLGFLYAGLAEQLAVIESSDPVELELPADRDLILTRDAALAAEGESFSLTTPTPGLVSISPDQQSGWLEIDSQKQDILARIRVNHGGPVVLAADAEAYPIVIRHDPIAHAVRSLILTALIGSFSLALIATGVTVMVRNLNKRARHRQSVIDGFADQ